MTTRPELLTLSAAAKVCERSVSTLRRWIQDGRLRDHRTPGDTRSPVMVDKAQLLALCSGQTPRVLTPGQPVDTHEHPSGGQGEAVALQRLVDELASDKRRLVAEVDRLHFEVAELRRINAHLQAQLQAPAGRRLLDWIRGR